MKQRIHLLKIILFPLFFIWSGCGASRPDTLGVREGALAACPDSPNCVSTQADKNDSEHRMEPIAYSGEAGQVREKILAAIRSMERSTIITADDIYIHAEFRSKIMKYVDDVEFYIDDRQKLIHFRSASRLGYSDMGVNRERMNRFLQLFNQL